jgi:NADH-quinone oxidoreductase subunit L
MSDDLRPYLWLIPGLPLLAAVGTTLTTRLLRKQAHWPCVLAIIGSFVVSLLVFRTVLHEQATIVAYYPWFRVGEVGSGGLDIGMSFRADALSAVMVVMVTFVASWIAIYSIGYMGHETTGYPRFFAEISLFVAAMTTLVLGDNFFVLYMGWEGVGLCSYLLIGYWFERPSAALAARKAFLVTRIGDVGLFLGIMLLWWHFGTLNYFSTERATGVFTLVKEQFDNGTLNLPLITLACLFLFCGAAGKSAQFPLHVWLPDAMEGPSPVSALIHAATMVTAGVYLVARCTPLFVHAPEAQLVVACIGGFTSLFAALIALTQNDLKRMLAYSTLSQLGYMFLALGCAVLLAHGSEEHPAGALVVFAVTAAMFHLFTHAFFKALLFLAAGSVMHAMGDVIDMRRFSGLRKVMPYTHETFLIGALALAGFPLLSGFWSKDEILAAAKWAGKDAPHYGGIYFILLVSGLVTAGLTAFYTFRAYFMTFWGELRVPPEADAAHGHGDHAPSHGTGHHSPRSSYESPPVMTVPLMVLAAFALAIGLIVGAWFMPEWMRFDHFLRETVGFPPVGEHEHQIEWGLMGLSTVLALGGIGLAWWLYVRQPELPAQMAEQGQALYQLSVNKFYVDELYNFFIVKVGLIVAWVAGVFDLRIIDQIVDLIGSIPAGLATLFKPIQNGLVQFYALAMVLGITVFILALLRTM